MPKPSSHSGSDRNGCHKVVSVLSGPGCSVLVTALSQGNWLEPSRNWLRRDTQNIPRKHWETFESSDYCLQAAGSSEVVMTSIVLLGVWLSREVLNNYWCWTLEPNKIVGIFFLTSWRGDAACCGHKSQSLTVMAGIGQYQGIFITMTSKHRQGHCLGYFVFCSSLCPRPLPALIILVLHQPAPSHCHLSSSWRCKLTLLLVFMFVVTTSDNTVTPTPTLNPWHSILFSWPDGWLTTDCWLLLMTR